MKKDNFYHCEKLDNGLRVVMEKIPHVRSISLGIWIEAGSRNEVEKENGVAHFLEHLLFKGTKRRNAKEIAQELESVGGRLDAFTSKELTCLIARSLDTYLDLALELTSDIYHNSTFPNNEIERERQVVLEEIKMNEDTPEELIHDLFSQDVYPNSSVGRPVLGNNSVISSLSKENIIDFFKKNYTPAKTIIALSGNFSTRSVVKKINKFFGNSKHKLDFETLAPPKYQPGLTVHNKEINQVHLCLGTKGLEYNHKDKFVLQVLNIILGGSMSSRLFQEVREKRGLVYTIYSFQNAYKDGGTVNVYAGTSKEKVNEVLKLTLQEINSIKKGNVTIGELNLAKEQLKGNIALSAESTESIMGRLARCEIYLGRYCTLKEIMNQVDKVKKDDVIRLSKQIFNPSELSLVCLGPIDKKAIAFSQ